MYRKPSGQMGFSFQKFMNNAAPAMMIDSSKDPGHISAVQRDLVFNHQMYNSTTSTTTPRPDPRNLVPSIFFISGIIDHETVSQQPYKKLQKASVLSAEGRADTRQIGPDFTHQMALIGAARQKQIIDMLFWWESECERLDRFEEASRHIEADLERARMDGDEQEAKRLKSLKGELERKRTEKPSARTVEEEQGVGMGAREDLPLYSESA